MNTCDMPRETKDKHCFDCGYWKGDEINCPRCAKAKAAELKRQERFIGKRCCECRASEHEDFDPIVGLCVVRDPETGKVAQRGYICEAHVEIRTADGYDVYLNGRKLA